MKRTLGDHLGRNRESSLLGVTIQIVAKYGPAWKHWTSQHGPVFKSQVRIHGAGLSNRFHGGDSLVFHVPHRPSAWSGPGFGELASQLLNFPGVHIGCAVADDLPLA